MSWFFIDQLYFFFGLLLFPAFEYAIAAACFTGLPLRTSVAIFSLITALDFPVFKGIISPFVFHYVALTGTVTLVLGVTESVSSTTSDAVPSVCT
jgi:hypothetical protein